ncbi:MAG: ADP-ribosylglycohydrolase family protein [Lentisphaeria bacterium]|nr:ADP-ribosylglycohydrolase family protein [Lentisphaeria bacterium]
MKTCFLYGAIGGDIIGSRFEWNNLKSKDFQLFTDESVFTDDTVLTIATADAILHKTDFTTVYSRWGNEYPRAGYGGSFRKWMHSREKEPYNSWGNGSAMRISPVGWIARDIEEVLSEAKASAEVTHNHPEGIKGAQAAALAVFMAKNGASKDEIRKEIENRFGYELSSGTLDDIRPEYSFDVSCQGTLPVALRAFLESEDYEDAIRTAVSIGGDSDTIAAITGGIALAFYKDMPYHIILNIERRLTPEMRDICSDFFIAYN